jgi:hypothetical protein
MPRLSLLNPPQSSCGQVLHVGQNSMQIWGLNGSVLDANQQFGLLDGGLATLSTLGLDIVQNILGGGGLSEIPLLGGDISAFLTPEGLISGASGLASFRLPIAIPVVGPEPLKLYAPVVLAILETQGLPVGGIPLPF